MVKNDFGWILEGFMTKLRQKCKQSRGPLASPWRPKAAQRPAKARPEAARAPFGSHFDQISDPPRGDFRAAGDRFLGSKEIQVSRGFGIALRGLGL